MLHEYMLRGTLLNIIACVTCVMSCTSLYNDIYTLHGTLYIAEHYCLRDMCNVQIYRIADITIHNISIAIKCFSMFLYLSFVLNLYGV